MKNVSQQSKGSTKTVGEHDIYCILPVNDLSELVT